MRKRVQLKHIQKIVTIMAENSSNKYGQSYKPLKKLSIP